MDCIPAAAETVCFCVSCTGIRHSFNKVPELSEAQKPAEGVGEAWGAGRATLSGPPLGTKSAPYLRSYPFALTLMLAMPLRL